MEETMDTLNGWFLSGGNLHNTNTALYLRFQFSRIGFTNAETVLELFVYHSLHHTVSGFLVLVAPIIRINGPMDLILLSRYAE